MSRLIRVVSLMAILFVGFGPVSVKAFDIPGTGGDDSDMQKKKKKKKKDDSNNSDTKSTTTTKSDSSSNSDTAAAKDDSAKKDTSADTKKDTASSDSPKTADSGAKDTPAEPVTVQEFSLPLKTWDEWYKDAKVGDYVVHTNSANATMKIRQEVVEIGDHMIGILYSTIMDKYKSSVRYNYRFADPEVKEGDESIKVGDKSVATKRKEVYQGGKLITKTWTSAEVPLGGLVKTEVGEGKTKNEQTLIEFGRGK